MTTQEFQNDYATRQMESSKAKASEYADKALEAFKAGDMVLYELRKGVAAHFEQESDNWQKEMNR